MSKQMIDEKEERHNLALNSTTNIFIPSDFRLLRDSFDSQQSMSSRTLDHAPPPYDLSATLPL